jgi:hypothetical protein
MLSTEQALVPNLTSAATSAPTSSAGIPASPHLRRGSSSRLSRRASDADAPSPASTLAVGSQFSRPVQPETPPCKSGTIPHGVPTPQRVSRSSHDVASASTPQPDAEQSPPPDPRRSGDSLESTPLHYRSASASVAMLTESRKQSHLTSLLKSGSQGLPQRSANSATLPSREQQKHAILQLRQPLAVVTQKKSLIRCAHLLPTQLS